MTATTSAASDRPLAEGGGGALGGAEAKAGVDQGEERARAVARVALPISDRDLIIATFNAVGALARQLTGKTLIVTIGDVDGMGTKTYASPHDYLFTDDFAAALQPTAVPPE